MRRLKWVLGALALATGALGCGAAQALDWTQVTGHVTVVEASYMPTRVTFTIDQPAGTCTAGTFLIWYSAGSDSTQLSAQAAAVLSLLMTAKVSGQPITVWGNNAGCAVTFIHLGSS